MVTVGIDVASSRAAVDLAGRFSDVHAAVAVHPHEAGRAGPEAMADLGPLAAHPKVVAVGETGLDYAKDYAPREVQRRVFIHATPLPAVRDFPPFILPPGGPPGGLGGGRPNGQAADAVAPFFPSPRP